MVAAEYEATQMYMQLAESTDNKLAIKALTDIADKERVHAESFCDCSKSSNRTKKNSMRKAQRSRSRARNIEEQIIYALPGEEGAFLSLLLRF